MTEPCDVNQLVFSIFSLCEESTVCLKNNPRLSSSFLPLALSQNQQSDHETMASRIHHQDLPAGPPLLFFHNNREGTSFHCSGRLDPIMINCRSFIDEIALKSLHVIVSQPDNLLRWLDENSATYITDLGVFVDAVDTSPPAARWDKLFERLGREAINLENLSVYWDHYDFVHEGLGKDLCFVRALTQLKVKKTITLKGFYAQP